MPSWKKIIVSGSDASLSSLFAPSITGSLLGTASFSQTASFVNTLNQNVLITGSLTVGASSIGANENTLTLGPRDNGGEGGQLMLQAPGGTYTSASMLDNYNNLTRLLRGTNDGSDAVVAQWSMHTKQMQLPAYNSSTAFSGTAAGYLAFDSSGNIITTAGVGSAAAGSDTQVLFNNTGTTAGTSALRIISSTVQMSGSVGVTGSLTATNSIIAQANGAMYFRGGDDAELWDINVANTVGIYGQQNSQQGAIKLGSDGPTLHGSGSRLGIGTTGPVATLDVNGNLFVASGITGSLQGTASFVNGNIFTNNNLATSASYAITASHLLNYQQAFPYTGSAIISGSLVVTGSINATDGITGSLQGTASYATQAGNSATINISSFATPVDSYILMSNVVATTGVAVGGDSDLRYNSSTNVLTVPNISATTFTGSLQGTASFAVTASYAINAETSSRSDITLSTQILVLNQSGYTIPKGLVVHITASGNSSDIPRVVSASYDSDLFSANTLGIATENITNGSQGFVITEGVLTGIDTSLFQSGQLIYLGAQGTITGSAPRAPLHSVRLGQVIREQSNNGSIHVRVDNGYELGELHDVTDTTTSSSYGDLLVKSGSVWISSTTLNNSYTISGSLTITNDLIVQGSSSIQYITSSQLNIGDNIISVNTLNPTFRFGGLAVVDSGSVPQQSGSMLFDSQNNQWIFVHQSAAAAPITSSVLIMGPQTYDNVGNETTLTTNRLAKATGGDLGEHIGDSNITDTGTAVSINSNTAITGSLTVTGTYNSPTGNTIDSNALLQASLLYLSNNF